MHHHHVVYSRMQQSKRSILSTKYPPLRDCGPQKKKASGQGLMLQGMPSELVLEIFRWLDPSDLCMLKQVGWQVHAIASDDMLWKHLVKRDFGKAIHDESRATSKWKHRWYELYRQLHTWGWDDHKRHHSIKLSRDGLTATCSGTSYFAVRASRGISRGKHFFQISVEQPTCGGSQSFGIANGGIDTSKQWLAGWTAKENGLGWYNDGNVYVRGRYFEKKFPSWRQGDVLGMLVCLSGGEAVVYFYKNNEQVPHRLAIKKPQNEVLYPYCLLGKGEEVRFIYQGKKGLHNILKRSVLKLEIKKQP